MPTGAPPVRIFSISAAEDQHLCDELEVHLALLRRQALIVGGCGGQRDLIPGDDVRATRRAALDHADVILLLLSAHYLASDECFAEMDRALARQRTGPVQVIPVLLRHAEYTGAPFAELSALPRDALGPKPVSTWTDRDEAWTQVVREIRGQIASASPPLDSVPSYENDQDRWLGERLHRLYVQREAIGKNGSGPDEVEAQIAEVERALRQGPQLRGGEFLSRGRYRLLKRLGDGGFATVWKAWDREGGSLVAIKVLHGQWVSDPRRLARFRRGAERMARLSHPGIVRVIDAPQEAGGFHYFVMEFLEGGDLRQATADRWLSAEQIIAAVLQVGAALQHAHEHGLVHRDVKPANILLDGRRQAHLTDFDLVWAADTTGGTQGGGLGTFLYVAPELLGDTESPTPQADVFSLGMTLIAGLLGHELPAEVLTDRRAALIRDLDASDRVKAALLRATERDPRRRFASMADFCAAVRGAPVRAAPRRSLRYALGVGLAAAATTAVVGTATYYGLRQGSWMRHPSASAPSSNPAQRDPLAAAADLLGTGRTDEALALLEQERARGNSPTLQRLLSQAYEAKADHRQALGHMNVAVELAQGSPELAPTLLADAQLLSRLGHASESCSVAAQVQAAHPSAEDLAAVETLTGALRCGRAGTAPDAAPVESPTIGGAVEPARLAPRRKKEARLEPTRIEPERRSAAPVSALPAAPAEQKGRAPDGGTSTGEAEARPAPESQTKRVAVHVVGEPPGGQAEFYGTGLAAQNAIIAYLRRLHVDAVPVSLHGLVSGLEAQGAALRVRAHYSLMVRMESLSISQGAPFSPLSLTGKVHVVLLQDGNARLDRSVFLPITAFAQSEPPGKSVARAITATMETLGTELTAQLARAE